MLDAHSPLGMTEMFSSHDTMLSEAPGFTLTQVAGDEKALKKAIGKLPKEVGKVLEHDGQTLFRTGPKQIWVLGEKVNADAGVYATPLSSGRTRLLLQGRRSREVLLACAAIDFHQSQFKSGQFVMTGIHHTPVLIHCVGPESFHIYALRSFALNVWQWLADVMEGLADD